MTDELPPNSKHTLTPQLWQNQTQMASTLALIVIVGIIIAALYLIQTTTTTTTARELEQMSNQRAQLERDNERLRAEIAQMQSLPRVMTRAAELGFREAREDQIQYIIVDGYHYNRPQIAATATPTPAPVPEEVYDETLSGWLRKQWDGLKGQFDDWANR
jgi:cell division protein FtsL